MCRALLVLAWLVLALAAPAQAQDTMLVLDASNSMWGRVDGRAKIAIAREAVAALSTALPAQTRMGLMSYGHRRAGDCQDIEVLIRPGPLDASSFARAVDGVTPRGRTPLAESITQAARLAPRIILVSDGIETCLPDPCGTIRALKLRMPRLQVNVIGFDVPMARDQAQLRCIAQATGGHFVPAASAADLARALVDAVGSASPPPPAPPPAPLAFTTLTLEAVEAEDGVPVQVGDWTLVTLTSPQRTVLSGNSLTRPIVRVPAGRYEVRARAGSLRVIERFDAVAPATTQRVVFNPGLLRTIGALSAETAPRGGSWMVWADEVAGYRAGEPVLSSDQAQPLMRLVQGSYRVRYRVGEASADAVVFVPAGELVTLRVDLGAGEMQLATRRNGVPVLAQAWEFIRQGDSIPSIAFSDVRPRVVLPAGQWLVRARVDNAWYEMPVRLAPGEVSEVSIPVI
ncbi:vWA domain-containing protein [Falsiroseomonas sp. HW251]|uniref:vWA domain-containing protein n=1 Tax=Falsiroseomonas sp. HW251 TaxID=3390998 RepID=UPI003D322F81